MSRECIPKSHIWTYKIQFIIYRNTEDLEELEEVSPLIHEARNSEDRELQK